ncbi:glycosyltransferase family 2 protein [Limnoraphis robusta]|uniref:Glycosyltransferase n=1 Tax=Limnoraphis robusta CCNP1315 TaxID=3110306 RepID=A0ABU5TUH5_9CYAN|nr:glycosyltransferase [Limnoraphis robusta]MEA5518555.1 glycosyltransferase [Limnoraphis robusta CCNP1315]MEA5548610.1 glycosyltransferase [Limnoraphis robusta CCNP1324]
MERLATTTEPQVTIIVVPRERFSCTRESLESIYEHTKIPFKLVYVDGNSPKHIQTYLKEQAEAKSFQLLRTDYYLSPNQARNIGLAQVNTKYLVFIDNDVVVTAGWLTQLMQCAEETDATVVGPLMCQERPLHEIVHCAGGESHIWVDKTGRRRFREKMCLQGKRVTEVRDRLQRQETELAEFHCVLVRHFIFAKIGFLDEAILNTKEHLDFCMLVRQAGGKVYFEPNCIVTYVPGPPLEFTDLHYYMLRWSDAWQLASLHRLRDKWNLAEDEYFKSKYRKVGWRRYGTIIVPLVLHLTWGMGSDLLARIIGKIDHVLINPFLTTSHAHRQRKLHHSMSINN